ncbi:MULTISPECIES: caspase family protein [unclassified Ensifer]|uniref:caspase family protein n=1 Tax=unclassified Ensifer TaxID=2633371 RepID=UPI000709A1CC|nr:MULTISPECIES: caspase family protein [unclassified Ensifer]KQW47216.1 peptidase C14 caspase catalytic subunit p20 [Ensifer sp. Root1252]KRC68768.1 peptidase C14 caspase catalytic subunit p20 [Ensifer sp. Root231]KRC93934.1 peptidase C14 caspase catalytic subunit p20 [Ensifer sp. Root258]
MSKRALIVGIDAYESSPLSGCVADAAAMATLLETDGNGDPNFGVKLITSDDMVVSRSVLNEAIPALFQGDADMALFYFAGHGVINPDTNSGHIVAQDGEPGALGYSLSDLLGLANGAYPKIKSTVVILDSCHSGFAGQVAAIRSEVSVIGSGVTILTASPRDGTAEETGGHGVFTSLLIDGLQGAASDICGRITPAALYTHVDQTLGDWARRPNYKANVQTFVILRKVPPKVPLDALRRLPEYFPDATMTFRLDPTFEPERGEEAERLKDIPVNPDHVRIYRELQAFHRHGLIAPVDHPHMWHAAINSTGCRLTASGAHYRRLALLKRI